MILAYLDEVGFSPSQPVNASWTLPGQCKLIPSEIPRRRHLNVLAALVRDGPYRSFGWGSIPRSLTAQDLLLFLRQLPRPNTPLVVVLANASIHLSHLVKEARPALAAEGLRLFSLPPYSPKPNAIEPYIGGVKYHDLPERRYLSLGELALAVDQAFERVEARVLAGRAEHGCEIEHHPRLSASLCAGTQDVRKCTSRLHLDATLVCYCGGELSGSVFIRVGG